MKHRSRLSVLPLFLFLAAGSASAEHPVAEAQRHLQEGAIAYREGDYEGFARSMERAAELNPSSYPTKYNLACGYARTGRAEAALDVLEQLAAARVDYGMTSDPDLESLREMPRFKELAEELARSIVPVSDSSPRMTVEQLGLVPEGIAYDRATDRTFFGSMRSGDVYVLDAEDQLSKFASLADSGPYSAIGMTVDPGRHVLWVVGTWFFMAEAYDPEKPHPAGLFGFDLESGELVRRHHVDASAQGLNDVAVAPNGDIYASGNVLHVLKADADALSPVETTPGTFGSNGLTLDPGGETLFVASYPVGLAAIDLESGELRYLRSPADTPLSGIDGLYWYEGDLIGIQNGIQPWRLLRMTLSADFGAVTGVRTIEFANPALTATTGAVVGNRIHYIGQAPSPADRPSQFPEALAAYLGKTVIMTAPLDGDRENR